MRESGASTFKPPSQLVCRLSRDDGGGVTSRTAVDSSMGNAGSVWPTAIWPKSKGCITNLGRNMSDTSILRDHVHMKSARRGGEGVQDLPNFVDKQY